MPQWQSSIDSNHCILHICACPAEAQSLASSQAGDAGAVAFSDAVYNYVPVRECLGGRAVQAQNAAAGKPLNPQPPPPPPSSKRPAGFRSLISMCNSPALQHYSRKCQ